MSEAAARSRVLVVGAVPRVASAAASRAPASPPATPPTFALVRPHHLARPDSPVIEPLVAALLQGSLEDYPSVLEAVRQVDFVICAVPTKRGLEQKTLIRAIKEAGCVKRLEFGLDPTKIQICDMDYGFYEKKIKIRRE